MNSIKSATKVARHPLTRTRTGRRSATLAVALACQLALPATAGEPAAIGRPTATDLTAPPAPNRNRTRKFAFTGMYRFATRSTPPHRLALPHLTTGSLPPPPIKPNDPQTGSLGGPGPANAAISAPDKPHLVVAGPNNPRQPDHSQRRTDDPATGRLNRISRADIAPSTTARFSEPLPPRTLPAIEAVPAAQATPTTKPVRTAHRSGRSTRRHRRERHNEGSALPTRLPNWWRKAWNRDGPS